MQENGEITAEQTVMPVIPAIRPRFSCLRRGVGGFHRHETGGLLDAP